MKNKKLFAILTLVCFMFTLMPVAAFAGADSLSAEASAFATVKANVEADKEEAVEAQIILKNVSGKVYTTEGVDVYVWAESVSGQASDALVVEDPDANDKAETIKEVSEVATGVFKVRVGASAAGVAELNLKFLRAGEYTIKASFEAAAATDVSDVAILNGATSAYTTVKVNNAAVDSNNYSMTVVTVAGAKIGEKVTDENTANAVIPVDANGVSETDVVVAFDYYGNALAGLPVTIETNSSSIEVSDESLKTNYKGEVEFSVSGTIEGNYTVTVKCLDFEADIPVKVGSTAAVDIELVTEPYAPIALNTSDLGNKVEVAITDINGNVVLSTAATDGVYKAANSGVTTNNQDRYVAFVELPASSKLENKDIKIVPDTNKNVWKLTLADGKSLDAEGTYTVKIILDNGRSVTTSFEVKKFNTPVSLRIDYQATTVELGGKITPAQIVFVDANGVEKTATNIEFAATGYAILSLADDTRTITVKSDEKYVGDTITVTAVSDKYDLVATKTLTVAEGATAVKFADASAEVNVNNKLVWNLVDGAGNKVALNSYNSAQIDSIKYIVLDKPADAKVSVADATNTTDLVSKGEGKVSLTSNKIGNVTVQVVVKAKVYNTGDTAQTKYYTGTAVIPVGTDSTGDVVVMSIGSNQIVKNDEVATMIAAPMIQNDRTFVPFRALSEAFGATVAWDEATQSVTAELNGVTVVLTIGSAAYTVNGVEKTADVAPFINGASTMVPVRFVAEAFGIKVIPTYDENGATADILFNL